MANALTLDSVCKRYDSHVAVDNLSMTIPTGTIYGILGPNGAGKTTTIRMALNIIARDSGAIAVLGQDPANNKDVVRTIGYLPEERGLYKKMKVLDVIVLFGRLKGMTHAAARTAALSWLDKMGLSEWTQARVESLSKGMQQKVQYIATVLHDPQVLILDEPTSGLDPVNQEVLRASILEAKQQGRTVILSTHNMEQAEQMCDCVCIIAGGRKVLDGALHELRRAHAGRHYRVELESITATERVAGALRSTPTVANNVSQTGQRIDFELDPTASPRDALHALAAADAPIASFAHVQPTLRNMFVRYASTAAIAERRPS